VAELSVAKSGNPRALNEIRRILGPQETLAAAILRADTGWGRPSSGSSIRLRTPNGRSEMLNFEC